MTERYRKSLSTLGSALGLVLGAATGAGACGEAFQASDGAGGAGAEAGEPAAAGVGSDGGSGAVSSAGGENGGGDPAGGTPAVLGGAGAGPSAPGYDQVVLDEKPLVYWRMGSLKDGVVPDATGNGNDLILQGTGHQLDLGGAIDGDDGAIGFDGAASFAIATDARALDFVGNAAFTLECWARRETGGSSYFQHVISNVDGVAGDRNGYALYLLPEPAGGESARSVFEYDRPAADLGVWGPVPAASTWGYYVAVFDGGQAMIYVDGTLADNHPVEGVLTVRTGPFAVARSSGASASFFKGALDEVAVYPRALGAKVIVQHFAFAK
jgi:hypothetical protein